MRELWFRFSCWWHGYNPERVREILAAETGPIEGSFDNAEDLLKYLNEN